MTTPQRSRILFCVLLGITLALIIPRSLTVIPDVSYGALTRAPIDQAFSPEPRAYDAKVFVDTKLPYYKSLFNRYLIGPFVEQRVNEHGMDAVMIAAGLDATLAASVHNLFHLCGFRRFIFILNNATRDCPVVFDLVPQHTPTRPHLCFDHSVFYSKAQHDKIANQYPNLHRGAPGKLQRGDRKVQIPRIGWYLQQFSKYLVPTVVHDLSPHYLAIDGDVIFTRPFSFQDENHTQLVMPITKKSPKNWYYFVDWIFGDDWKNDADTQLNFVVGWMVLDQDILRDLIDDMNRLISDTDLFPFNILNEAERIINQTFFSEFYVYARYAQHHAKKTMYRRQPIPDPLRNPGNFRYTCVLTKSTYHQAQSDSTRAPFLIWEEHKHHAFHSCPDHETTEQLTQLSTVGIWHDFHPPPWGGGNQFLLALREGMTKWGNLTVLVKSDQIASKELEESNAVATAGSSQVLLANSVTFKGSINLLEDLKAKNKLALVHRVDGPYFSTRYGQSFDNQSLGVIPQEDRKTKRLNRQFACATVFQSRWSLEANVKIGLSLRNPIIIPNTVDETIFYPLSSRRGISKEKKIRIVATSHSNNARKGFDTLLWLDEHLDWDQFELAYMGGIPKVGFDPKRITVLKETDSNGVADFLRTAHLYVAPSRQEPASNAVLEALACGLPVLYQEGSSHGDLVGSGGRGFSSAGPELLRAIDEIIENYLVYVEAIKVPPMEGVAQQYLSIMRWCFYQRHLYFQK